MEYIPDNIILFGPKDGKHLAKLYPELGENKLLKELPKDELLFAWYMGNRSSPIDSTLDKTLRAKHAAAKSFPSDMDKRVRFSDCEYPESVKIAIEEMSKYLPEARAKAKNMTQTMFLNLQKMIQVEDGDFEFTDKDNVKQINWAGKKQYVDTVAKISEVLPVMLKQLEEGFGIIEGSNKNTNSAKAIDRFHQFKKEGS